MGQLFSRAKVIVVGIMVAVAISACDKPVINEPAPEPGDTAVAKIEDQTVWASDVRNEAVAQGLIGEGEPLDITSDLFRRMLEEVIDQKLLAREAVKNGLDKSIVAQRRLAAARERILGDMLVEKTVDTAIDDNAVKNLYEEQLKLAKQSEEIRARLIMTRTREEGEAIIKQLEAGSMFEALAMEKSTDQATRFNGGDMGYFTTDVMPAAYKGVLANARPGQIAGPIETEGGFAILKVEDRRQEQPLSLDEARPQILRFLTYDQVRILLTKLRDKADVKMLVKESDFGVGAEQEPASAANATELASETASDAAIASSAAAPR